MGVYRDRLETLLKQVKPKDTLLKWFDSGYIPSNSSYVRNTIPYEDRFRYAMQGYIKCKEELNIDLYFDQAVILGAFISGDYDTGRVIAPPRFGKSFLMAVLSLILAKESYSVSVVAATSDKTSIVMEKARSHLRNSNYSMKSMLVEEEVKNLSKIDKMLASGESSYSKHAIGFKNGMKIVGRTTGDSYSDNKNKNSNIGIGTHVLIDEMDFLSESSVAELGRRQMERNDGESLILFGISNPRYMNHFYEDMTKPVMNKREFVIWMDVRTSIESGRFKASEEDILNWDMAKTEDSILVNLLCQYDTEKSEFFNAPMITKPKSDINYVTDETIATLGVDSAYKGTDGITIALSLYDREREPMTSVVETINLRPDEWSDARSTKEIVDGIEKICKLYNVQAIATDTGQGSHLIVEMANRESMKYISQYSIDFGGRPTPEKVKARIDTAVRARNKRAEMHLALRQLMQESKICFSDELKKTLQPQMHAVSLKNKELDKITLVDKQVIRDILKRSPDDLDATVLSIHALELYLLGV